MNTLYYGDNLDILRRYIKDEAVDLVYLDPPFKSNQDYNVLFAEQDGSRSAAQIRAFEDTWCWDQPSAAAYQEIVEHGPYRVSKVMQAFWSFLGTSDMMAYLAMMAPRLVELRRVLKPTGSIYLHCDPTASHYLKLLMDAIFSPVNYRNEIVWKRSASHGGATNYHDVHDVILYYTKERRCTWNPLYQSHESSYIDSHYYNTDEDGRRYQLVSAHGRGQGPPRRFGDRLMKPPKGRHWMDQETIDKWMSEGRVVFTRSGMPRYKRYLDDTPGQPATNVWSDIPPINSQAQERLGYPTQKPEALLERIIKASSKEGDTVLDPFCGCGTAVVVAERQKRQWIGIDITHLAITLIRHRLRDAFGNAVKYEIVGEPVSLPDAEELAKNDPYQFQWWALGLVGARPVEQKKGADKGIDGRLYFHDEPKSTKQIIFSVKAGHTNVAHVRDLRGVIEREKAEIGVLITLEKPTPAMRSEAASAGFYQAPWDKQYPRLQLLTIADLLAGKSVDFPRENVTFKKAPKARPRQAENKALPF